MTCVLSNLVGSERVSISWHGAAAHGHGVPDAAIQIVAVWNRRGRRVQFKLCNRDKCCTKEHHATVFFHLIWWMCYTVSQPSNCAADTSTECTAESSIPPGFPSLLFQRKKRKTGSDNRRGYSMFSSNDRTDRLTKAPHKEAFLDRGNTFCVCECLFCG